MNDRYKVPGRTGDWFGVDQPARPSTRKRAAVREAAVKDPDLSLHLLQKKEPAIARDAPTVVRRDHAYHVVAEDYSYKSEAYYTILAHELTGDDVRPCSRAVLDAFVVPVGLERASHAGIPVVPWGISQGYVPLPSILYGLNYFATTSDYTVVQDTTHAKEVIKHITNKGKYPFCYQKISDTAAIRTCTAIFGRTTGNDDAIITYAKKIYDLFAIPLFSMVFVQTGNNYALSSLMPTRYTHLSDEERASLSAYRAHQVFL